LFALALSARQGEGASLDASFRAPIKFDGTMSRRKSRHAALIPFQQWRAAEVTATHMTTSEQTQSAPASGAIGAAASFQCRLIACQGATKWNSKVMLQLWKISC
jgi:hypothetical protein